MSSPEKDLPYSKNMHPLEGIPAGQEPEVMPGFTAPTTDPWPPLSREQVVELHEALVDFRCTMEASKSLRGDDEQAALIWEAATSLDGLLVSLGIGTPAPTKRWSEDQLQQAVEEAQEFEPLASVRLTDPQGREADLSQVRPGDVLMMDLKGFGSVTFPAFEPMAAPGLLAAYAPTVQWVTLDEPLRSATGHAQQEARRQEGDWEQPPVKHNCGTCRNVNLPYSMRCAIADKGTAPRGWRHRLAILSTSEQQLIDLLLSSETPCPGWEPKP